MKITDRAPRISMSKEIKYFLLGWFGFFLISMGVTTGGFAGSLLALCGGTFEAILGFIKGYYG